MEEPRRMKTREEILREKEQQAQENAVKSNLEKYVKEMDTVMQNYLQKMREVKAQVDVKYKLSDAVIIRKLNERIEKLEQLEIPKEIQLNKQITYTTDKASNKFLWWHFVISLLVVLTSICIATNVYVNSEEKAKQRKQNAEMELMQKLPKEVQNYLLKNYPDDYMYIFVEDFKKEREEN